MEIGNDIAEVTQAALGFLLVNTSSTRFASCTIGSLSEDGVLLAAPVHYVRGMPSGSKDTQPLRHGEYELVLLPCASKTDSLLDQRPAVKQGLTPDRLLLATYPSTGELYFPHHSFAAVHLSLYKDGERTILAQRLTEAKPEVQRSVIVVDQGSTKLSITLTEQLKVAFAQEN